MSSHLPKYVRTDNSFVVYSNCIPNVDLFAKIYGYECNLDNAGFVQICQQEQRIGFQPSGERFLTGCDTFDEEHDKITQELTFIDNQKAPLRYITTSSRFIIFTDDLSYKEIANAMLRDFVIQGAGLVHFEKSKGGISAKCYGECKELGVKSRSIDSLILNDAFGIEELIAA